MHAHLILGPWEWISVKDHETENEYLLTILVNTIYRVGCKTYLDLRLKELWTVFRLQIQFQMKKRGISFRPVEGKLTNKYVLFFYVVVDDDDDVFVFVVVLSKKLSIKVFSKSGQ